MKEINTFAEYMADENRVTPEESRKIDFEVELIGKMIEAREKKGYSQRELAELSGVKQSLLLPEWKASNLHLRLIHCLKFLRHWVIHYQLLQSRGSKRRKQLKIG